MKLNRLADLLIKPHASIKNPETRRVILLLSAYHLFTIPIAPIIYVYRPELPTIWTLGIFTICLLFYIASRTPWARIMINVQLLLALVIPAITSVIEPDRQSVHFAYMVPVLLSTLLYSLRYLYVVSGLSITFFLTMTTMFPAKDPSLMPGSLILLSVLIAMVILSKHHVRWQEQQREMKKTQDRERYFALVNATFDGTATLSDGVFTHLSDGFSSAFSVHPDQWKGKTVSAFLHETLNSSEEIGPQLKLVTAKNAKGEMRFVQIIHQRISDSSEGTEQIMAVRDVTREQDINIQKLIMERLTSTGMVASSIAHEMNTPLMIAQRQLDLAASAESISPTLTTRLTSATSALEQMESILGDLRWFIQSGAKTYTENPVSVITNAVKLARHRIQYETEIKIDLPELAPLSISAGKLSQIVVNLIFNASKARKPDQRGVLITIEAIQTEGWVELRISDDGCGIPGHLQQRVFEPFYTSRLEEGMGLGLAICQSLVRNVDGRIELESRVNEGTCFAIHLPLEPNQDVEAKLDEAADSAHKNVLVIDDNQQFLAIMSELLAPNSVLVCASVEDAKAIINTDDFDAVFCDINMPQGGAMEFLKHLEAEHHALKSRLIFITGGAVDPITHRHIQRLERPILYKPFTQRDLLGALSKLDGVGHSETIR